jgi:hypothetical protein
MDKKFCTDQCRTAYHNRRTATSLSQVRTINHVLLSNRRILERFALQENVVIPKQVLIKNGYDFAYSTHSTTGKNGQLYKHVYEQSFLEVDAESVSVLPPAQKLTL